MKNNVLKKAVGTVTDNFGLKLLALILSCGLWFVVNSITDPIREKSFNNIPVEIINEDLVTSEGKVYEVLDGTNVVNVTIIGKSSVTDPITREDIKAIADMSELTFMNTVGIQVSSLRSNSALEFRTNNDTMKLSIEEMNRMEKPINASTSGEPAEGYVVGSISVSPNVVRLSGPESLISQVDHVDAVANIDGYSSDINTSVDLKLYDADNKEVRSSSIKTNISTVNVAVTILATKEVPISFAVSDEPADGYVVSSDVLSVPDKILIAGRKSALDSVTKISVADPALSVDGRTENMTSIINIKKYLPTGVQFADSSFNGNVSVTVGIEPLVTKELRIPARNFAVGNRPEGFDITLREVADRDHYNVKISGTRAAVEAVEAEAVIGVVDMDILLEKLGLEKWTPGSYSGEITFNFPDNVTPVENYTMTVGLKDTQEDQDENN